MKSIFERLGIGQLQPVRYTSRRRRCVGDNRYDFETLEPRQMLATIAVQTGAWDSATTWSNGVPDATERAIIPSGRTVTLTGTDHTAQEIVVQGILNVAESAGTTKTLTANWIHVNSSGVFQVGTELNRYDQNDFVVTLTGDDPTQTFNIEGVSGSVTDNDSFLMVAGGGRLQFFGEEKLTFTKLAATANVNATQITVENVIERNFDGTTSAASDGAVNWEVGDQIVIASSSEDYDDEEVRNITAVTDLGNGTSRITLNSPLNNRHYGEIETYSNSSRTWDLDLRAEVALLSRNVRVQGEAWHDTDNNFGDRARFTQTLGNTGDGFGGHIMIMGSAGQVTVDGVQLDKLGQTSRLGRYPIHWHVAGDRSGDILRSTSITNSNNRGVTIHGTHNVLMQDVLLHDVHGHGFFMEDAVETGNQYISNIAFGVHQVGRTTSGSPQPNPNDPFVVDTHDHVGQNASRFVSSASYWITNPDNTWVGNISAGSAGTGFWFIFPDSAIGLSASDPQYNNVRPDRTNLRQFDFNSSHSSPAGLNFDRGSDLEVPVGATLKENFAGDNWLPSAEPQINNFTAYKHNVAIYHRGFDANFHENMIADSNIGTFITFTQRITDTLYVGHSRGNAELSDSVTGHTIYDGANTLDGIHFAGFAASNAHTFRTNGSALRHTSHVMSNTSFEDDGSGGHVSVGTQGGGSSQTSPFDLSPASIYDADGTLTGHVGGGAGWTVVTNHPFFYDSDDIIPSGWNAAISDDIYAMLNFDPNGSNSRFRATAPDGDQITDAGTSRRNTHIKVGNVMDPNDDYRIDLSSGSYSNVFDVRYWTRTGPTGPSVIRFEGFGNTLRPQSMNSVNSLEELRAATQNTFTVFNGDVYVKAFSSSSDIRMRSFTSTSPNAVNDTAQTDAGVAVQIPVINNDNDNDGDTLSVVSLNGSSTSGSVVADYQDDFQTGSVPSGWQYLWNSSGAFGNPSDYSALQFDTWRFKPNSANFPYLSSGSAHPGDGTEEGPGIERHAIAAWTVTQDGEYSITDSVAINSNQFSDGVNVKVHVTGGAVTTLATIGTQGSGNFDTSLGFLTAGQTIYVGVGPNEDNGGDGTNFDFSIRRATQVGNPNGSVQIVGGNTVTYTPNAGFFGVDTFSYQVSDGRGGTDTATVTVTVDQPPAVIPSIVSVIRDGGDQTRPDQWMTLQFVFDTDVVVSSSVLQMFNLTDGGSSVSMAGLQFGYDSSTFTATWTLDSLTTPLAEAYFSYLLDSSTVTATVGGKTLDGSGDGFEGGFYFAQEYVALPGDADLDGDVDVLGDATILVSKLGTTVGSVWTDGNFNGDGAVDILGDAAILVNNLGRSVVPMPAASASLVRTSPVAQTATPDANWETAIVLAAPLSVGFIDEPNEKQTHLTSPATQLSLAGSQNLDAAFVSRSLIDDGLF